MRYGGSSASGGTLDYIDIKSNCSLYTQVPTATKSHGSSVQWNTSLEVSVEKNSLSSDDGTGLMAHGYPLKRTHTLPVRPHRVIVVPTTTSSTAQPRHRFGQSLPNLNLSQSHTNNTLLVPGRTTSNSDIILMIFLG